LEEEDRKRDEGQGDTLMTDMINIVRKRTGRSRLLSGGMF
jgi:hypothetical protein